MNQLASTGRNRWISDMLLQIRRILSLCVCTGLNISTWKQAVRDVISELWRDANCREQSDLFQLPVNLMGLWWKDCEVCVRLLGVSDISLVLFGEVGTVDYQVDWWFCAFAPTMRVGCACLTIKRARRGSFESLHLAIFCLAGKKDLLLIQQISIHNCLWK